MKENNRYKLGLGAAVVALLGLWAVAVYAEYPGALVEGQSRYYMTIWSLLPPMIAIVLALLTKEVYSSLFIGIIVGGMLYSISILKECSRMFSIRVS